LAPCGAFGKRKEERGKEERAEPSTARCPAGLEESLAPQGARLGREACHYRR